MAGQSGPSDRLVGLCFIVSALASIGLTIVYARGGQPQVEGALLGVALGGVAFGLIFAVKLLLPTEPEVHQREDLASSEHDRREVFADFTEGADVGRRRFIGRTLAGAIGALGVAALFPIRSLGERPGEALFHTRWSDGSRMVTELGEPIRADELVVNTVVTVFPEEFPDAADSQLLLIRLPPEAAEEVEDVGEFGLIAYSKICTHAGCPVGLYEAASFELFCPCHQSTFLVLQNAKPAFGPATRPLPRLPVGVDENGYVIALGDFPEAVGPGFWNRPE